MKSCSKRILVSIICAGVIGISACSTSTHRLGPSQAALDHYGIGNGDTVLIRFANKHSPRSSSRSELIRITEIKETGIAGVSEGGTTLTINFTEIFQIEYTNTGLIDHDSPVAMGAGHSLKVLCFINPAGC